LDKNKKNQKKEIETMHFQLRSQGLDVKGWRKVPINTKVCGKRHLKVFLIYNK